MAGQFQSFDFNRDQISLAGEDPTGRLQTLLEATFSGITEYGNIVLKPGILETFADTIEAICGYDINSPSFNRQSVV